MMDFKNSAFAKLREVNWKEFEGFIVPLLTYNEEIIGAYKGIRDGVVFTNKRVMSINVQGITGTKKDITSIPYSKIQVYSIETAGGFDLDAELDLYISGMGSVRFEFGRSTDITKIARVIGEYVLS